MRSRAVLLIVLLFGMAIAPMASTDSTISTSTTWSGNVVLTGNVTVDSSSTLVLEPGTVVDAQFPLSKMPPMRSLTQLLL